MECVAVRYRVPTLLLLGDTLSSSRTPSTFGSRMCSITGSREKSTTSSTGGSGGGGEASSDGRRLSDSRAQVGRAMTRIFLQRSRSSGS